MDFVFTISSKRTGIVIRKVLGLIIEILWIAVTADIFTDMDGS